MRMVFFPPLSINIKPRTLRLLSMHMCVHLGLPLLCFQALLFGMMLKYTLFWDWIFHCRVPWWHEWRRQIYHSKVWCYSDLIPKFDLFLNLPNFSENHLKMSNYHCHYGLKLLKYSLKYSINWHIERFVLLFIMKTIICLNKC